MTPVATATAWLKPRAEAIEPARVEAADVGDGVAQQQRREDPLRPLEPDLEEAPAPAGVDELAHLGLPERGQGGLGGREEGREDQATTYCHVLPGGYAQPLAPVKGGLHDA